MLYEKVVPFLVKLVKDPNAKVKPLAAGIIAARIEFDKLGLADPGDILELASEKIYELTFSGVRDTIVYSKDSKVWHILAPAVPHITY